MKCDNFEIEIDKIPVNMEIKYLNQRCLLIGSSEVINYKQFKFNKNIQIEYKNLLNYIFNKKLPSCIKENGKYTFEDYYNIKNKLIFNEYNELEEYFLNQFKKQINDLYKEILKIIKIQYPLFSSEYMKLNMVNESGEFENLIFENNDKNNNQDISKIEVILELFKMLKCNSVNANLKKLNKTTQFGDRVGRKNSINIKSGTLIYKSPTGLKEKKYEF